MKVRTFTIVFLLYVLCRNRKSYIYEFESFYFMKPKKLYLGFEPELEYRTKNKIRKFKKEIEIKSVGVK